MSTQTSDISPIFADNDDISDSAFSKRRCCFCIPFLSAEPSPSGAGSVFWRRINPLDSNSPTATAPNSSAVSGNSERWWKRGWNKVREWSEIIAGPKWKTLIRRINRRRDRQGYGKFHYDPLSYALNFDEGPGQNSHYDEDLLGRGFSARYSLPPTSAKSSLDFDRDEVTFHVSAT